LGFVEVSTNPTRSQHEYIIVLSRGSFKRRRENKKDTISFEEFLELTRSVWRFSPESATKIG